MNCEYCGSVLSPANTWCTNCGASAPTQNAAVPTYTPQPQQQYQPYNQNQFVQSNLPPKMNSMALAGGIVSLVSLVCGFCGVAGIVGLILSIIGLTQINKTGERGRGWALTGIIIGVAGIVLGILTTFLMFVI